MRGDVLVGTDDNDVAGRADRIEVIAGKARQIAGRFPDRIRCRGQGGEVRNAGAGKHEDEEARTAAGKVQKHILKSKRDG